MKNKLIAGVTLAACLLLVTGCQNPVKKVVDKAKDEVKDEIKDEIKDDVKNVKNDIKDIKDDIKTTSDKLSCTMTESEGGMSVEMKLDLDYDTKANKPKNISLEMNMNVGTENVKMFQDQKIDFCTMFQDDNDLSGKCTSSVSGGNVKLKYAIDEKQMNEMFDDEDLSSSDIKSLADLKVSLEKEGFKCK